MTPQKFKKGDKILYEGNLKCQFESGVIVDVYAKIHQQHFYIVAMENTRFRAVLHEDDLILDVDEECKYINTIKDII